MGRKRTVCVSNSEEFWLNKDLRLLEKIYPKSLVCIGRFNEVLLPWSKLQKKFENQISIEGETRLFYLNEALPW